MLRALIVAFAYFSVCVVFHRNHLSLMRTPAQFITSSHDDTASQQHPKHLIASMKFSQVLRSNEKTKDQIDKCVILVRRTLGSVVSTRAGFRCSPMPCTKVVKKFCIKHQACLIAGMNTSIKTICNRHFTYFINQLLKKICGSKVLEPLLEEEKSLSTCYSNVQGIFGVLSTHADAEFCDTQYNRKYIRQICKTKKCLNNPTGRDCKILTENFLRNLFRLSCGTRIHRHHHPYEHKYNQLCFYIAQDMIVRNASKNCHVNPKRTHHRFSHVCSSAGCKKNPSSVKCKKDIKTAIGQLLNAFCSKKQSPPMAWDSICPKEGDGACRQTCNVGYTLLDITCEKSKVCCIQEIPQKSNEHMSTSTFYMMQQCRGDGLECRPSTEMCGASEFLSLRGCKIGYRCCETDAYCFAEGGICRSRCPSMHQTSSFDCHGGISCCLPSKSLSGH